MKLKKREPQKLYCSVCLYVKKGLAEEAITIKGGTAVCYDHLGHINDPNVANALLYLKRTNA